MPAPSTTLIRVPTPLHTQLKHLASLRGVTMVDLVHSVIRDAVATGELPGDVPGFRISLDLDQPTPRVILGNGDEPLAVLDAADVKEFADKLENVVAHRGTAYVALEGWQVMIRHIGTGIVIERQNLAGVRMRRILTPAFASDLASRLRDSLPTNV